MAHSGQRGSGSDHEVRGLLGVLVVALGSRHRLTRPFAAEALVVCRLRPPPPDCFPTIASEPIEGTTVDSSPSTTAPARATRSRRSRLHRGEPRRLSSKGSARDHQRLPYTEWCHCEACLVSAVPHLSPAVALRKADGATARQRLMRTSGDRTTTFNAGKPVLDTAYVTTRATRREAGSHYVNGRRQANDADTLRHLRWGKRESARATQQACPAGARSTSGDRT